MASKNVKLSTTVYTKLDTGTDTAILCQNVGSSPVRVVFASALPGALETAFFRLNPGQALPRDSMTGNMNAIAELEAGANVTVGE